ncbi:hypothetical protein [Brevibacillus choshinensis]|uniref:hypothetical protein n=1 Tax=Brevibacillus choshinensis TaxID=54911 RepID=UPI000A69C275|nr:hypothetical protein [Brevibacillus choshinensis]
MEWKGTDLGFVVVEEVAVLFHQRLTLLALSNEMTPEARRNLEECGIHPIPFVEKGKGVANLEVDGLLLTRDTDVKGWEEAVLILPKSPGLLLVYGEDIPYGWTESEIVCTASLGGWEVVRMAFFSEKVKVLIGGEPDGYWVRTLCRLLAHDERVSLVCKIREVDEVIRQLPRYLDWKERFYLELGEVCDREGVSLQTVARALGMDRRVGQEWLFPDRTDHAQLCRWIEREGRLATENANVQRIALWGPTALWNEMDTSWLKGKEVCLLSSEDEPIPNEIYKECSPCDQWQKALQNTDLLVIGRADAIISEMPLNELVHYMKQANVVDACACFPVQEACNLLKSYRAIGEKTNVWE